MIGVSPGACSLPRDPSRKPIFSSREHHTGKFYEQFENNVGADLDTFIDESAIRWRGERQQKTSSFFLVVGKQNVSLPVNKWSIGFLEKLRGPTAIKRI